VLPHLRDLLALAAALGEAAPTVAVLLALAVLAAFVLAVAGVQLFGPLCTPADRQAPAGAPARGVRCWLVGDEAMLTDVFNFQVARRCWQC
jgi:hypothetical protein